MNNKILMATGQYELDHMEEYLDEYEIIGTVDYKDELEEQVNILQPNIVIVGTLLGGRMPLFPILNSIKINNPEIRIIFLTTEIDVTDKVLTNAIGVLTSLGVYDIIEDKTITPNKLLYILENPKEEEHIVKFKDLMIDSSFDKLGDKINLILPSEEDGVDKLRSNVVTFVSSKGGTGKSTLAINTALAISEMGINNEDDFSPKVLVLDLDIYQFSAGRILNTTHNEKNLITVLEEINRVIKTDGSLDVNNNELQETIEIIEDACHKVKGSKNMFCLSGPNTAFNEDYFKLTGNAAIAFLITVLSDRFDMIIVDTGNDLQQKISYPILKSSQNLYYVLDMDFQTFLQEGSFAPLYKDIDVDNKIKYILNRFIVNDDLKFTIDEMVEVGYKIDYKVDLFNPVAMLNNSFNNEYLIKDKGKATENIRFDLLSIADDIWGIKNFGQIKQALKGNEEKIVLVKDHKKDFNEEFDENDKTDEVKDGLFSKIGKNLMGKKK